MCPNMQAEAIEAAVARRTEALVRSGKVPDVSMADCQRNYKKALEKGVLKILSKMGISLLSCYHGAQIFEIYGLGKEVRCCSCCCCLCWSRCLDVPLYPGKIAARWRFCGAGQHLDAVS